MILREDVVFPFLLHQKEEGIWKRKLQLYYNYVRLHARIRRSDGTTGVF